MITILTFSRKSENRNGNLKNASGKASLIGQKFEPRIHQIFDKFM